MNNCSYHPLDTFTKILWGLVYVQMIKKHFLDVNVWTALFYKEEKESKDIAIIEWIFWVRIAEEKFFPCRENISVQLSMMSKEYHSMVVTILLLSKII